jgi:imidazolonepropionase-like amidohydrolase
VPPHLVESWPEERNDSLKGWTTNDVAVARRAISIMTELVGRLHRAGVRILAGADSTVCYVLPGMALQREIEIHVDAGLSPADALVSATSAAAEVLRRPDLGRIAEGQLADFVLLGANPLQNIAAIRDVRDVYIGGVRAATEKVAYAHSVTVA